MNIMEEVDIISSEAIAEQEKAEKEGKVIPKGKYEGLIFSWNLVPEADKRDGDAFQGVPLYKAGIVLYDCPEYGKKKTGWFKFTTSKVLGESGKPKTAYTTAVGLTKAMNMPDVSFTEVLEQAKVTRAKYDVGAFTPEGKDETYNFLRSVQAL